MCTYTRRRNPGWKPRINVKQAIWDTQCQLPSTQRPWDKFLRMRFADGKCSTRNCIIMLKEGAQLFYTWTFCYSQSDPNLLRAQWLPIKAIQHSFAKRHSTNNYVLTTIMVAREGRVSFWKSIRTNIYVNIAVPHELRQRFESPPPYALLPGWLWNGWCLI